MTQHHDWEEERARARQALPEELAAEPGGLPAVLLPYQADLLRATAAYQLVVCEKSRRIGMTWGVAADAVLTAGAKRSAGGMDALYIGFNLDMAREFIDTCAMWAKAFMPVASEVQEFLFTDVDDEGDTQSIQAFRIRFASGFEIIALTSKPRSLRGRQGFVIFDEAAFHDELAEMLKAAIALTMWGGKLLVISTHDGTDNPFNELVQEVREGNRKGHVIRVDIDDALAAGLYERIALTNKLPTTSEARAEWVANLFAMYGEAADEELRCIPARGTGVYFSRAAIEACMTDSRTVARFDCPDGFELRPMAERTAFVEEWLEEHVRPHLRAHLRKDRPTYIGEDFGRTVDLTVITVGQELVDLKLDVALILELKNCPLAQQRQVLRAIRAEITVFGGAKFDATGNGLGLAEDMAEEWGHELVECVKISVNWYLETMPTLKGHVDDQTILLPNDAPVRDDLRAIRLVRGVPSIPPGRVKGRHGDAAISLAMFVAAAKSDYQPLSYESVTPPRLARDQDREDRQFTLTAGFNTQKGLF